ncbi:MAG: S8 family serine peptidase [Planctomycetes bacterium]|nr:S8 family serine peptidase [Planctomycetota bacterium]
MTIRRVLLLATFALPLPACGGGGAASVDAPIVPATPGSGGDGGVVLSAKASRTQILVDPTTSDDLRKLCEEKGSSVIGDCPGTAYCIVEVPKTTTVEKFLEDVADESCVEDAMPDEGVELPGGEGSTIPAFVEEDPSGVVAQAALERIGASAARLRDRRGEGVVVAIVDTGVDAEHPFLRGRVLPGWDFVDGDDDASDVGNGLDDDRDGDVDEGVGHGTFVASLVLAVAPMARILPVRALDSDASGSASSVAQAVSWAVSMGARVVNFSGGLSRDLRYVQQAVESARASGVLVVAAAGNTGAAVQSPARIAEVLAVSSVGLDDVKSDFAAYGPQVDLVAPGEDLVGAHPLSPTGYARWSGTSFATALVTGAVAIMQGMLGVVPPDDLVAPILSTAVPVDDLNPVHKDLLGAGRLDLDAATR